MSASTSARALLLALALTAIAFATTPVTESNRGYDFDGVFYGAMAGSPLIAAPYAHVAPWCYRILTPALVHALPWDTLTAFRVVAFTSSVASLWLLFLILRQLLFSEALSAIGVVLYAGVFWTVKFAFYSPAYIDDQTSLFLLAMLFLALTHRYALLIPVAAAAALQKESLVVFTLFAVAHAWRESGRRLDAGVKQAATALALSLVVLAAVRTVVRPLDDYSTVRATLAELPRMLEGGFWLVFAQSLVSGLGLLPAMLAARPRAWRPFLQERFEWLVYAALSVVLLFGGIDKARLMLYAVPLVVILVLCTIDALRAEGRPVAAWVAVGLAVHLYLGGHLTPMGSYGDYLARLVPEHAGDGYLPYLARNAIIVVGFLVFSWWTQRTSVTRTSRSASSASLNS